MMEGSNRVGEMMMGREYTAQFFKTSHHHIMEQLACVGNLYSLQRFTYAATNVDWIVLMGQDIYVGLYRNYYIPQSLNIYSYIIRMAFRKHFWKG